MAQQSASILADIAIPDSLSPADVELINALAAKGDSMSPEDVQKINATLTKAYKQDNPKAKQPPVTSWVDTALQWIGGSQATERAARNYVSSDSPPPEQGVIGKMVDAGQSMADPRTVSDFVRLAIPNTPGAIPSAVRSGVGQAARAAEMPVSYPARSVAEAARALGTEIQSAPGAGITAKVVGKLLRLAPSRKTFQDLPLAEQMERLPAEPRVTVRGRLNEMQPDMTRSGGPPHNTKVPFHEQPLYKQMEELPSTAAPDRVRTGGPPPRIGEHEIATLSKDWQAAKAATPTSTIADDVQMVRALKAIDYSQEAAIKIVSGGDKELAELVKQGYLQTLKQRGAPIPAAALKTSGKVPPDVSALMETPTFKALADALANRQP